MSTYSLPNRPSAAPILLENDLLRVELDGRTGRFTGFKDKSADLELLARIGSGPVWRIELADGRWLENYLDFSWETSDGNEAGKAVTLQWTLENGCVVRGHLQLGSDPSELKIMAAVMNTGTAAIDKIEYPILTVRPLSDTQTNYLVHSQGTGFLFQDPHTLFQPPADDKPEPQREQGIRYSPYIEGFNGSPSQFMTYFTASGGFYLATHDNTYALKWLNFYKNKNNELEASFMHQFPHIENGNRWELPYPVVIAALPEGSWYAAADKYKAWAIQQPWTSKGTLWNRQDKSCWLLEEVGFCTFGINSAYDRSAWFDFFHKIADKPVFHVLGVNWSKGGGDYRNNHPGGCDDWFPAHFNRANLDTIRANGDYWAPFEFDLLFASKGQDTELISQALQVFPEKKYSFGRYAFPFLCPTTPYLQEFHPWRDTRLVAEYDADGLYYDISVNTVLMSCRHPGHGHPVGGGGWLVNAYFKLYETTKKAIVAAAGTYVPQGTESMNEPFIPYLDFYQARADASPLSIFEADFFRDWIKQGRAEKIPLFAYLYHEYGPVRMDGWAKLSRETGELFYWVAGRVTLWGGLLQLNYEFSDLEALDGKSEDPAEHYYDFQSRAYEIDPEKVAFVREVALARQGFANDYLAYGKMLRPQPLTVPTIELNYFLYNAIREWAHHEERGSLSVPAVLHSAWNFNDEKVGYLYVNLQKETPIDLTVSLEVNTTGLPVTDSYEVRVVTSAGIQSTFTIADHNTFTLTLPSRQIVLVEIIPGDA